MAQKNIGEIVITSKSGEKITLNKTSISIKFTTPPNSGMNTWKKTMNLTVTISGEILSAPKDELIKIFDWSKNFETDEMFRKVDITITEGSNTPLRYYELDGMGVYSYNEHFGTQTFSIDGRNVAPYYELVLQQKADNNEEDDCVTKSY